MNLELFGIGTPEQTPDGVRDPLDRYYTPEWATQALVDYLGGRLAGGVWEPCVGKDWIGRVIRRSPLVTSWHGTDIDPDASILHWDEYGSSEISATRDFMHTVPNWPDLAWIVTNPPYKVGDLTATDFVRRALQFSQGGVNVAMLLRLTWLEPCADRSDILANDPPTDVLILPRVHFINAPSSNNCTSAWVIWDRNRPGSRVRWHRGRE